MADEDIIERRRFSRRALLLAGVQIAGLGALGARLYQLQVVEAERYAPLADDNRIATQIIAPERGRILDRNGVPLAVNIESFRAVLIPALSKDAAATLALLSRIVPIAEEERARLLQRARRQARSIPVVVATDLSFEQVAEINLLAPQLPGIQTEIAWKREYKHGHAVGHVVGHTGAIERIALDDDPVLRLPGMRIGRTGVELALEEVLRGRAGTLRIEVDARGRIVRQLARSEPERGRDVTLTLDAELQARVMRRLARERRASAVAIDLSAGEIAVMASYPGHDPNDIINATAAWQRQLASPDDPFVNRAVAGLYPPGSTFKMVTALAALRAGKVSLKERIACEGSVSLGDQTYRCWRRSGHGRCDLHRAIKESCDVYFYEIARRSGIDAIADTARRLGLGQVFDCGVGLQKAGVVPDADWKRGRIGRAWTGGETLIAGIGQGYVLSTPLQLAVMTARLASGRAIDPTAVRAENVTRGTPPPLGFDPAHLAAISRAMMAVVHEEGGTGANARLDDDDDDAGPRVAGKTGTSQVNRASTDRLSSELKWEERDHALFVAFVPADRPRYALAVVVEHGGGGGAAAAPVARDIMREILAREAVRVDESRGRGRDPQGG